MTRRDETNKTQTKTQTRSYLPFIFTMPLGKSSGYNITVFFFDLEMRGKKDRTPHSQSKQNKNSHKNRQDKDTKPTRRDKKTQRQ